MQGRGDSSSVAPGGRDVPCLGALGAFPSQVVQPGPGGNPNLTSINLHEKRSVEEKPQARLAAPGVCAAPPGLLLPWLPALEWVRAQPWAVPTHSRMLMGPSSSAHSVVVQHRASLGLPPSPGATFVFPRSSVLPGGWDGLKELLLLFPTESCKEASPTGWVCKGRLKRRDHKEEYKD